MKKLSTILAVVLITTSVFAQAPQKMSYQAVIRNNSGTLVTNQSVGMRVSISTDSTFAIGNINYREIYNPNPSTNANGLLTIEIGTGLPIIGTFAGINWSIGTYYIKTETDPTGGTSYTITGKSQLISVPYALYSGSSGATSNGVPVGTILPFGGTLAPAGYLLCDGTAISRTTYATLFSVLNTTWGFGNGSTTFNVPDLRGRFMRGVDGTAGNDPDNSTRTAINAGGNVGNNVGSLQSDQLASHTHGITISNGSGSSYALSWSNYLNQSTQQTNAFGGNETRPKNVNVNYIIKY